MNTIQIEEPTITLREDNPMRALCYIEGYIGCVMAEHGLTIDPELQKRFNIVYMAIEPPNIINVSAHGVDMGEFEQSEAHRVLAKVYSTMPVGEPSVHIKVSREAFKNQQPFATTKATYHYDTVEVAVETKYHLNDTATTSMPKVIDVQSRVTLEALPNDVLKTLYMSVKLQMEHRELPL